MCVHIFLECFRCHFDDSKFGLSESPEEYSRSRHHIDCISATGCQILIYTKTDIVLHISYL